MRGVVKAFRRPWVVIPAAAFAAFATGQLCLLINRDGGLQYGSRSQIIQTILEATPRGTPRQAVRSFVKSKGWGKGGRVFSAGGPEGEPVDRISVYLGEAQGLIVDERVFAEWIFDANDKLIDVDVYKITLMP
jgi:hypothetical protein